MIFSGLQLTKTMKNKNWCMQKFMTVPTHTTHDGSNTQGHRTHRAITLQFQKHPRPVHQSRRAVISLVPKSVLPPSQISGKTPFTQSTKTHKGHRATVYKPARLRAVQQKTRSTSTPRVMRGWLLPVLLGRLGALRTLVQSQQQLSRWCRDAKASGFAPKLCFSLTSAGLLRQRPLHGSGSVPSSRRQPRVGR